MKHCKFQRLKTDNMCNFMCDGCRGADGVIREELVRWGLPSEECCGEMEAGYREEMHVPLQPSVFGGMNLSSPPPICLLVTGAVLLQGLVACKLCLIRPGVSLGLRCPACFALSFG